MNALLLIVDVITVDRNAAVQCSTLAFSLFEQSSAHTDVTHVATGWICTGILAILALQDAIILRVPHSLHPKKGDPGDCDISFGSDVVHGGANGGIDQEEDPSSCVESVSSENHGALGERRSRSS